MFAVHGEQSGGSSQVTRSLVSCDEDFEFYSQCVIAMKEQMSKQTEEYRSEWSARELEGAWFLTGRMSSHHHGHDVSSGI